MASKRVGHDCTHTDTHTHTHAHLRTAVRPHFLTLKPHFISKRLDMKGVPCIFHNLGAVPLRKCQLLNPTRLSNLWPLLAPCPQPHPAGPSTLHPPATWLAFSSSSTRHLFPLLECFLFSRSCSPPSHHHSGHPVPLHFTISPDTFLQGSYLDHTPDSSSLNYSADIFRAIHPLSERIKSILLKL